MGENSLVKYALWAQRVAPKVSTRRLRRLAQD